MARALRPLGRRRRSHTRFVLDEAASVERYADTGTLVPVWQPERERFFSATLLVEDTPALPLWRGLARELETLLARQGGFRRFRRLALSDVDGRLHLRSRSGALHPPRTLLDDDAALVLVATDGTTDAWADGRMAALLAELGARSPLALLQWLPERLWPNTALGGAPLQGALPRAGAANAELRITRPRWLRSSAPFVAAPLAALSPAGFARLAATLMGRPGAQMPAALLWQAPVPVARASAASTEPTAAPDATERIARFRGVASARVLQTAVQLSAAAPLTLPVIRLVHRVLQPDAPAGDLPLLLLGGLLERCAPPPPAAPAARRRPDDGEDDELLFDFAPGVREALQASLLKPDADAVRQAVSRYIAERSGSPVDFTALLLDPDGAQALPGWARPFAEVTRQVQALFTPPPDTAADDGGERLREIGWAPGVTVQAEERLDATAHQIAWAPDGGVLAVRHADGLRLLRPIDAPGGPRAFAPLPIALDGSPHMVLVKGTGLAEAPMESLLAALRTSLADTFRGTWRFTYHTVDATFTSPGGRAPATDVRQVLRLATQPRALLVFIGDAAFSTSPWMRAAEQQMQRTFDLSEPPAVVLCIAEQPLATTVDRTAWQIRSLDGRRLNFRTARARAEDAGQSLAHGLGRAGTQAVPEVAFGPTVAAIAWNAAGDLLVADARRQRVLRERDLHQVQAIPRSAAKSSTLAVAADPQARRLAIAGEASVTVPASDDSPPSPGLDHVVLPGNWQNTGPLGDRAPALAWSGDGEWLVWRDSHGQTGRWSARTDGRRSLSLATPASAGPVWRDGHWAFGTDGGDVLAWRFEGDHNDLLPMVAHPSPVQALTWSPDGSLLAAAWADGRIALGRLHDNMWTEPFPIDAADLRDEAEPIVLAFMPPASENDAVHETLAVAQGERLWLLRVDPARLGFTPAPAVAPTTASATEVPGPDDMVAAAGAVLHAMALAFHVGALLPGLPDRPVTEAYAALTGRSPGTAEWSTLRHVVQFSEYVFYGPLNEAMASGLDPLADPDVDAGRRFWRGTLRALESDLQKLSSFDASTPPQDVLDALHAIQASVDVIAQIADDLAQQTGEAEHKRAQLLRQLVEAMAALRPPPFHRPELEIKLFQSLLATFQRTSRGLAEDDVSVDMAPAAARAQWLRADLGRTPFSGMQRFDAYVDRLVAEWLEACAAVLAAPGGSGSPIEIRAAVERRHLDAVAGLVAPIGVRITIDPALAGPHGGEPMHDWSVPREDFLALAGLVGNIVATALARRLDGPPPNEWAVPGLSLLWADDRPLNNDAERRQLQFRGFRVAAATDTAATLQVLEAGQRVDVVISDMGRPPDAQAGYTLLDEMRSRGFSQPLLIYAARPTEDHREEARRRGAIGTTANFEEIEEWLKALFVAQRAMPA